MNGTARSNGYTILELMIVLAISGTMFLIAAIFVSGKQAQTAFYTGANELTAQIQATISQVQNGQYSDVSLTCKQQGSGIVITAVAVDQGDNSGCVFLGKFIQFQAANDPTKFDVFEVAGSSAASVTDYSTATAINGSPNLTRSYTVPQSLQVTYVHVGSGQTKYGGIGFFQNPASGGNGNTQLTYVPSLTLPQPSNGSIAMNTLTTTDAATICVTDGARYAEIRIGSISFGNKLSATLHLLGTTPCA